MNPFTIILHHSLTKDNQTVSWGAIKDYHVNINGWSDNGYHFGIEMMRGNVEILMGRMTDDIGAHCRGYNSDSIGIVLLVIMTIDRHRTVILMQGSSFVSS